MKMLAVKSINKNNWPSTYSAPADLLKEVDIQKNLDHPGIIKIYDVVQTDTQVNIVMELAAGGDLFDQVASDYQHDLLTGGRKEQSPGSDFDARSLCVHASFSFLLLRAINKRRIGLLYC